MEDLHGDFRAGEVQLGERVGDVAEMVDEVLPPFVGFRLTGGVDGRVVDRDALILLAPADFPHLHEVDHPRELRFRPDGELKGEGDRAELFPHLLDHSVEIGADPVVLVDVGDAGHRVAVSLMPDGLRLRLDAAHGIEDGHGAVQNAAGNAPPQP